MARFVTSALRCALQIVVLVACASSAQATALTANPMLDVRGQGLTVRIEGSGLRSGAGTVSFPGVNGDVRRAMLYWGGVLTGDGQPHDELIVDGQLVVGTAIGSETAGAETWYGYRADVTAIVGSNAGPGGIGAFTIEDPAHGDPSGMLNGASVLLYHTDPTDPHFYRAMAADGCDFAFGPNLPNESGLIVPVPFSYDAAPSSRAAEIRFAVGNADPVRRDRVDISDNKALLDDFVAADGSAWDSLASSLLVPANVDTTTIQVVSPPQYGNNADRLQVLAYAFRIVCGGLIGDFVWTDDDGDGLQDPLEPGLEGIGLDLYIVDNGQEIKVASTVSDEEGYYEFSGLCAGEYLVRVDFATVPFGLSPTTPFVGNDPEVDSNYESGAALVVLPDDGTEDFSIDIGFVGGISNEPGACCFSDGDCLELTEPQCGALGGAFQGVFVFCTPTLCPVSGACCLLGGVCMELSPLECSTEGGTYQGDGVPCDPGTCVVDGACCLFDGSCIIADAEGCAIQGGTFNPGSSCNAVTCVANGSCCLFDGTCVETTEAACGAQGGAFFPGVNCGPAICVANGACCLFDGTCIETIEADCLAQGGSFDAGVPCGSVNCPVNGACCLFDGTCVETVESDCTAQGGSFNAGQPCGAVSCPVNGACCLDDGTCVETIEADCLAQGGSFDAGQPCDAVACPQPGACCLPSGACIPAATVDGGDCTAQGGTYIGAGTSCDGVVCGGQRDRVSATEKGSLLVVSDIEVRWDALGNVVRDVFIQITNDFGADVRVLGYLVNGDAPIDDPNDPHPGWNFVDNEFTLTANQSVWWSVESGIGTSIALSPISTLDPGPPPGRPADDDPGERVLRAMLYLWAVAPTGEEIRWNHLAATATTIEYRSHAAWSVNAWSFQAKPTVPHGAPLGTPGELRLDGNEYVEAYNMLLLDFVAEGATIFSGPASLQTSSTRLALHPVSIDFRDDPAAQPIRTRASFDVWNENEVKLSGAYRCVTCWDEAFLAEYGVPNHFHLPNLQTNVGKARIDGAAGGACPGAVSTAILGVSTMYLGEGGGPGGGSLTSYNPLDAVGTSLHGMGFEMAVIRFDPLLPPPEAPERRTASGN